MKIYIVVTDVVNDVTYSRKSVLNTLVVIRSLLYMPLTQILGIAVHYNKFYSILFYSILFYTIFMK